MKTLFTLCLLIFPCLAQAQTPVFSDDFDGGVATGWTEIVRIAGNYASQDEYTTTPTPISGSHAAHYYQVSGINDAGAVQFGYEFGEEYTEVALTWYEYFKDDFPWPSSQQKIMRFYHYDSGLEFSPLIFTMGVQTTNSDVDYQHYCGGGGTSCSVDFATNSGEAHPENEWIKWTIHIKLNTLGASDGFIKLYKNDVLYLSDIDVDLRGNYDHGFSAFWVGGNSSMLPAEFTASSGSRYLDDVNLYDGPPPSGSSSSSTSSSAAQNCGYLTTGYN